MTRNSMEKQRGNSELSEAIRPEGSPAGRGVESHVTSVGMPEDASDPGHDSSLASQVQEESVVFTRWKCNMVI